MYNNTSQLLSNTNFKKVILSFKKGLTKSEPIVTFHFVLRGMLVVLIALNIFIIRFVIDHTDF